MNEHMKNQLEVMNQQVKELASIYNDVASKAGISDNELWIWYAILALGGEYSQQDICELWALPKQTVNSIVSNLVKKDLISLEVVSGTRNRKMIHPTEKGRAYGEAIILPIYHAEQQAFEGLSESERQTCITLLGKYILLLKEACNNEREVMP